MIEIIGSLIVIAVFLTPPIWILRKLNERMRKL